MAHPETHESALRSRLHKMKRTVFMQSIFGAGLPIPHKTFRNQVPVGKLPHFLYTLDDATLSVHYCSCTWSKVLILSIEVRWKLSRI
jgi:hypothetical protein